MKATFYPDGLPPLGVEFDEATESDLSRRVAHLEALYQAETAAHQETRQRLNMLLALAGQGEARRRQDGL